MVRGRPVIGITGGIGSGKSTVARLLGAFGCVVADSDGAGRAALEDPEIKRTLIAWWGQAILDDSGAVDRRAVGRIVFADESERKRLEGLTHPWIEARRREQFEAAGEEAIAFVIDAPLLLEAGLDAECDVILFVEAPFEQRLERVQANRGWDASELARREESQLPLDAKRQRADDVLLNDGDLKSLRRQVGRFLDTIRS